MTIERQLNREHKFKSFSIVHKIQEQTPEFPNISLFELVEKLKITIVKDIPLEYQTGPKTIAFLNHQDQTTTIFLSENTNPIQKRIAIAKSVFCLFHLKQQLPDTDFSQEIYDLNSSNLQQMVWDNEAIKQYLLTKEIIKKTYSDEVQNGLKEIIPRISDKLLIPTPLVKDRLIELGLIPLEELLYIDPSRKSLIDLCE